MTVWCTDSLSLLGKEVYVTLPCKTLTDESGL